MSIKNTFYNILGKNDIHIGEKLDNVENTIDEIKEPVVEGIIVPEVTVEDNQTNVEAAPVEEMPVVETAVGEPVAEEPVETVTEDVPVAEEVIEEPVEEVQPVEEEPVEEVPAEPVVIAENEIIAVEETNEVPEDATVVESVEIVDADTAETEDNRKITLGQIRDIVMRGVDKIFDDIMTLVEKED